MFDWFFNKIYTLQNKTAALFKFFGPTLTKTAGSATIIREDEKENNKQNEEQESYESKLKRASEAEERLNKEKAKLESSLVGSIGNIAISSIVDLIKKDERLWKQVVSVLKRNPDIRNIQQLLNTRFYKDNDTDSIKAEMENYYVLYLAYFLDNFASKIPEFVKLLGINYNEAQQEHTAVEDIQKKLDEAKENEARVDYQKANNEGKQERLNALLDKLPKDDEKRAEYIQQLAVLEKEHEKLINARAKYRKEQLQYNKELDTAKDEQKAQSNSILEKIDDEQKSKFASALVNTFISKLTKRSVDELGIQDYEVQDTIGKALSNKNIKNFNLNMALKNMVNSMYDVANEPVSSLQSLFDEDNEDAGDRNEIPGDRGEQPEVVFENKQIGDKDFDGVVRRAKYVLSIIGKQFGHTSQITKGFRTYLTQLLENMRNPARYDEELPADLIDILKAYDLAPTQQVKRENKRKNFINNSTVVYKGVSRTVKDIKDEYNALKTILQSFDGEFKRNIYHIQYDDLVSYVNALAENIEKYHGHDAASAEKYKQEVGFNELVNLCKNLEKFKDDNNVDSSKFRNTYHAALTKEVDSLRKAIENKTQNIDKAWWSQQNKLVNFVYKKIEDKVKNDITKKVEEEKQNRAKDGKNQLEINKEIENYKALATGALNKISSQLEAIKSENDFQYAEENFSLLNPVEKGKKRYSVGPIDSSEANKALADILLDSQAKAVANAIKMVNAEKPGYLLDFLSSNERLSDKYKQDLQDIILDPSRIAFVSDPEQQKSLLYYIGKLLLPGVVHYEELIERPNFAFTNQINALENIVNSLSSDEINSIKEDSKESDKYPVAQKVAEFIDAPNKETFFSSIDNKNNFIKQAQTYLTGKFKDVKPNLSADETLADKVNAYCALDTKHFNVFPHAKAVEEFNDGKLEPILDTNEQYKKKLETSDKEEDKEIYKDLYKKDYEYAKAKEAFDKLDNVNSHIVTLKDYQKAIELNGKLFKVVLNPVTNEYALKTPLEEAEVGELMDKDVVQFVNKYKDLEQELINKKIITTSNKIENEKLLADLEGQEELARLLTKIREIADVKAEYVGEDSNVQGILFDIAGACDKALLALENVDNKEQSEVDNQTTENQKSETKASFTFYGIQKQAAFFKFAISEDNYAKDFNPQQESKEQGNIEGFQYNPANREPSALEDKKQNESWSMEKLAKVLKAVYDNSPEKWEEIKMLVQQSNAKRGDDLLTYLELWQQNDWNAEAALEDYNRSAVEERNRSYFQKMFQKSVWNQIKNNPAIVNATNQLAKGEPVEQSDVNTNEIE